MNAITTEQAIKAHDLLEQAKKILEFGKLSDFCVAAEARKRGAGSYWVCMEEVKENSKKILYIHVVQYRFTEQYGTSLSTDRKYIGKFKNMKAIKKFLKELDGAEVTQGDDFNCAEEFCNMVKFVSENAA